MNIKTQQQELEQAVVEQRQPLCLGCQRPLDVVRQMVPTYHTWAWDRIASRYQKHEAFGDAQTAYHAACDQEDAAFVGAGRDGPWAGVLRRTAADLVI